MLFKNLDFDADKSEQHSVVRLALAVTFKTGLDLKHCPTSQIILVV